MPRSCVIIAVISLLSRRIWVNKAFKSGACWAFSWDNCLDMVEKLKACVCGRGCGGFYTFLC